MNKNIKIDWSNPNCYDVTNQFYVKWHPDNEDDAHDFNVDTTCLVIYSQKNKYEFFNEVIDTLVFNDSDKKTLLTDPKYYEFFLKILEEYR